jgi:hypothetical protein
MDTLLKFGRIAWLAACVAVGTLGGTYLGFTVGGGLGAVACGLGGAFVGLLVGASFVNAMTAL